MGPVGPGQIGGWPQKFTSMADENAAVMKLKHSSDSSCIGLSSNYTTLFSCFQRKLQWTSLSKGITIYAIFLHFTCVGECRLQDQQAL